jgi:hypothetical protein
MRKFAIVFATLFAVALICIAPMLYRAKSADKPGSSPAAEERVPLARRLGSENGIRFSQPLWLLVLGTALIVSANRLSRVLQARARVPLPAPVSPVSPVSDDTRARGSTRDRSLRALSFDSNRLDKPTWLARESERSVRRTLRG